LRLRLRTEGNIFDSKSNICTGSYRKNDQVLWIGAPELDKMHGIPEAQAWMTAKHDTRLPVLGVHYLILRNKRIKFYARIRIMENAAKSRSKLL
jgi:hypothetical protein